MSVARSSGRELENRGRELAEEEALQQGTVGCCKFFYRRELVAGISWRSPGSSPDGTVMLTGTESISASPRLLPPPNLTKSNGEEGAGRGVGSVGDSSEFSGVLSIGRVGTEVSSIATTVIGAIEISTDRFVHTGNA